MPLGIYRLVPLRKSTIQRGMFVATCAPLDAAMVGLKRGYLARGPCPFDTELLLKAVVAVVGDDAAIRGIAINGCLLPHSRPLSHDAGGRRLSPRPQGQYHLRSGQIWLYADNDRSWDSRYWGPSATAAVAAQAVPLLVAWKASGAAVQRASCAACLSPGSSRSLDISRNIRYTRNLEFRLW